MSYSHALSAFKVKVLGKKSKKKVSKPKQSKSKVPRSTRGGNYNEFY